MSRMERGVAALLLGVAVAGGVLIPRLLSGPAAPLGVAIGAGPGRIVVEGPAIARVRPAQQRPSPHAGSVTRVTATPAVSVVAHISSRPKHAPVKRIPTPPAAPPATSGPTPPTPSPPSVAATTPPTWTPTVEPAAQTSSDDGDEQNPPTGHGHDLRGFGHGTSVRQAAPHAVGPHHRGVGHLAPPPAGAAQAAHEHGAQARPEARGRGGQRSAPAPAQPVAHGDQGPPSSSGHGDDDGQGHGHGDGNAHGDGNDQ